MLKNFLITLAVLMFLDYMWLGIFMEDYYFELLKHIVQNRESQWIYNWPFFLLTYLLLAAGLTFFVVNKPNLNLPRYFLNGAFFGFISYGSFNLTNYGSLPDWPIAYMLVDVAWGTISCGIASSIAPLLQNLGRQ